MTTETVLEPRITYYRPTRVGPEAAIEAAVARSIGGILPASELRTWLAGSLPIGAGMPDLLAVLWEPRVIALADSSMEEVSILAYLRAVGCARRDTIVKRLACSASRISSALDDLVDASVLTRDADRFALQPVWRRILPEIVAIEAKVSDWKRAFRQASRNQVFAHRSFVALPRATAERALEHEAARNLGIGVLSVDEEGIVTVRRRAVTLRPRIWTYYYQLAKHVAIHANPRLECLLPSR